MADTFLDMAADSLVPVLSGTHSIFTLPIANSDVDLANDFLTLFVEKVEKIRSKITADTGYEQETRECEPAMPCFEQLRGLLSRT